MNRARLLLLACLIGTASACGSNNAPLPTTPDPIFFTEVFSGTVTPSGGATFTFISQASGRVTVTVTALTPDPAAILGVSVGTVASGGGCQVVVANDRATLQSTVVAEAGSAGNLCARVYDPGPGVVVQPLTYDLTVVHP